MVAIANASMTATDGAFDSPTEGVTASFSTVGWAVGTYTVFVYGSDGNIGSASAFLIMEELLNSGRLKKDEHLMVMVPESARFSYAFMYLTVV
jgi:3-oxoacyl-[acyl-carrier-protein] synthase-3